MASILDRIIEYLNKTFKPGNGNKCPLRCLLRLSQSHYVITGDQNKLFYINSDELLNGWSLFTSADSEGINMEICNSEKTFKINPEFEFVDFENSTEELDVYAIEDYALRLKLLCMKSCGSIIYYAKMK